MKTLSFNIHYSIGQEIYHRTPDSAKGIITDINYNALTNTVLYLVSFGRLPEDQSWFNEFELSETKTF